MKISGKILLSTILFIALISYVSAIEAPAPTYTIPTALWVVGENCYSENHITDSIKVNIAQAGKYEIKGIVERGNPNQSQINEAFYLTVKEQQGPVSPDDADPIAITTRTDSLGEFSLVKGENEIIMHTAAKCPPDKFANSVRLTSLLLYLKTEPPAEIFLNIISPKPQTYNSNKVLLILETNNPLSYYSIDTEKAKDYTGQITLELTNGTHTVYAYTKNSSGRVITKSVNFTISPDSDNKEKNNSYSNRANKKSPAHNCEYYYYNYFLYHEPYNEILCPDYDIYEEYFSQQSTINSTVEPSRMTLPEENTLFIAQTQTPSTSASPSSSYSITALIVLTTPLLLLFLLALFLLTLKH